MFLATLGLTTNKIVVVDNKLIKSLRFYIGCARLLGMEDNNMQFNYNDGGRKLAGYKGDASDCVVRAIAIASQKPYQEVYDALNTLAQSERTGKRKRTISNSRSGVFRQTYEKYLKSIGAKWTPTMLIGQGCKVHLRSGELPMGRLVVSVSKHMVAVIDGVVNDTHDPSRDGSRCVYGYYTF